MRHARLPEQFTSLGFDEQGRQYVQCTRTGDVLVQTGPDEWGHFADADQWRERTAAQLYPALIHLQRALKAVGRHEEIEAQVGALREAEQLLDALRGTIRRRIVELEEERATALA